MVIRRLRKYFPLLCLASLVIVLFNTTRLPLGKNVKIVQQPLETEQQPLSGPPNWSVKIGKPRVVSPIPDFARKKYYATPQRLLGSTRRALDSMGWQPADPSKDDKFHLVLRWASEDLPQHLINTPLKPWQRFNQLQGTQSWNLKDKFAFQMRKYANNVLGIESLPFIPTTYILQLQEDKERFLTHLNQENGMDHPHVAKIGNKAGGTGVSFLAPNSESLKEVKKSLESPFRSSLESYKSHYIIQEHICTLLVDNRKFDTRSYMMVASVEPLVVLFHEGIIRVSGHQYNGTDFSDKKSHLSNVAQGGEKKILRELPLLDQHFSENKRLKQRVPQGLSPIDHVKNQMKSALGHFVRAFQNTSFTMNNIASYGTENGYALYGVDFMIDQDLDVWLTEVQTSPGLSDQGQKMYKYIHNIVEEVQDRQSKGQYVLPLSSIVGGWEVVYSEEDGYVYEYEFDRSSDKKKC
eukprot:CAMPEP_0178764542 /NCGR_PEP_ID=MMETSP0744-20121128/17882_1 /TAXON_ID=913974 /ORGANISM="Nitzschia punctata, Strain CCMP561" /LENGTH=464 /DNA_ID=CAMNT_0020419795 /DNA_START=91 /DNA_END=1485 /DNA_ORIENTATION=+